MANSTNNKNLSELCTWSSSVVCTISLSLSLFFNLLLFVYVASPKYWTEILQYDLLKKCTNMCESESQSQSQSQIEAEDIRWGRSICSAYCCLPKIQRKWIRLWRNILYFGYPLLWQATRRPGHQRVQLWFVIGRYLHGLLRNGQLPAAVFVYSLANWKD